MAEMAELFQKHHADVCLYLAIIMATRFCKQLAHDVHQELWQLTQTSDLALFYGIDAEEQEDVVWKILWRLLAETDVNHNIAATSLQASVRRLMVKRTVPIRPQDGMEGCPKSPNSPDDDLLDDEEKARENYRKYAAKQKFDGKMGW